MKARESTDELLSKLQRGDRGALARLLSLAESEPARYAEVADRVTALSGRALRVGITGPGGAGKSTLIDALVARLRADGRRVAILATDPSSERTGGALLGDRVRYTPGAVDEGVFFRSVATRGAAGGFAHAGFDQLDLLDAAGFDWLLVEAVGAGQSEVEIAYAVDLTVVVLPPASGDAVQAMKAGVMEAGDLFVVGKCDLPGAEAAAAVLRSVVELPNSAARPPPPVLLASATQGTGIPELAAEISRLAKTRHDTGDLAARRRDRLARRVRHLVQRDLESRLATAAAEAAAKGGTPQALAKEVRERLKK